MWDLFSNTLAAARILNKDEDLQQKLSETIDKLYGPHIGSWGQLMEWMEEKPKLEKSHHRHTSHLFAVYPGRQISREKTPELAKGAALSLLTRGTTGDSRRSWTWPWRTALWARFGNPDKCYEMVHGLFQYNMLNNMFATHPPFQMDGNFGITAGICEMLLQSQTETITLLPALPKEWKNGSIKGIRARGGYIFDLSWQDGKLTAAAITATVSGKCKIKYGKTTRELKLKAGEKRNLQF
jgi:alpha-L-fucosidase 2